MEFDPEHVRKVEVALALGRIAAAAVIHSHHGEKRKSQGERDDPGAVEWICGLGWDLFDDWQRPTMNEKTITATTGRGVRAHVLVGIVRPGLGVARCTAKITSVNKPKQRD